MQLHLIGTKITHLVSIDRPHGSWILHYTCMPLVSMMLGCDHVFYFHRTASHQKFIFEEGAHQKFTFKQVRMLLKLFENKKPLKPSHYKIIHKHTCTFENWLNICVLLRSL